MRIYELLIGFSTELKGCIWCTDGSFIDPDKFSDSGKEAYGYVLDNYRIVSLNRTSIELSWAESSEFKGNHSTSWSSSLYLGSDNSEKLKSSTEFSYINCPAIYYACTQVNADKVSYMPACKELQALYRSIMSGSMKKDLITAGLYEKCNYRMNSKGIDGWGGVWSSSEYTPHGLRSSGILALFVNYMGEYRRHSYSGKDIGRYVIPFFKIRS